MFLSKKSKGVYYLYYNQSNGKRTSVSTNSKLKSEAVKFLREFKVNLDEEIRRGIKPITLKNYIHEFLKYSEGIHSWNTTKTFKTTFNAFQDYFGEIDLDTISQRELIKYFEHRIRDVSVYQARKDRINLSSMFTKSISDGFLLINPCVGIKRIKIPEKQPMFFNESELQTVVDNIKDIDIKDLVLFAVNTGLRQMELLTLEWNQIDFNNKIVILDNRNHLTKSKKVRSIPINERAFQILKRRVELNHSKVFTIEGNEITQKSISNRFSRLMRKFKMKNGLNFHSLRHSFASFLVQRGASIYEVSKLLGHSSVNVTQIYAHLTNENLRSAVELI
jgi:site-specific recombinase XerD